jgi:ribosome biogenesis GTPase A
MLDNILKDLLERPDKFIKENEDGMIEYKLRLDLKDQFQLKKFTSQLLWRLNEGLNLFSKEIAVYVIGVYDDGTPGNIHIDIIENSIQILQNILTKINASIQEEKYILIGDSNIYTSLIRLNPKNLKISELNVMFCGDTNSGKSSIIANLCNDVLDSGSGSIRNYVLKHPHEKISGQTTSICKEIIGIRNDSILNYTYSNNWAELIELSQRVISLYDTPGDLKYIHNIIYGILTFQIDLLIIVDIYTECKVLSPFTLFLQNLCQHIKLPYKIILNKNDLYQINEKNPNLEELYQSISVKDGSNIDKLRRILIELKKNQSKPISYIKNYYTVTDSYNIPHVGKILTGGQIVGESYQNMLIKVITNSNVYDSKIVSIYKKYIPTDTVYESESGSVNLLLNEAIRIDRNSIIIPSYEYDLLKYYSTIKVKILNQYSMTTNDNYNDERYLFFNGNNISECSLQNNILTFSKNILLQNNLFVLIPCRNKQTNILDSILVGLVEKID